MLAQRNHNDFRDEFKLPLIKSLGLHLSFIVVIVGLSQLTFMTRSELLRENIQLVESSVRVDLVAMPVHTLQELEAMSQQSQAPVEPSSPAPAPEPEPISDAAPSESELEFLKEAEEAKELAEAQKKEQERLERERQEREREQRERQAQAERENFMNTLRQTGAREASRDEQDQQRRAQVDEGLQRQLQDLVMRGNRISEGVALVGGSGPGEVSSEFVAYLQSLPDHIRPHWRLPSYLAGEGLQCRVRVYLSDSGRLVRADVYESSGNEEYDRRALEAVRSASPFPALEDSFASRGARGDIVLGFPL